MNQEQRDCLLTLHTNGQLTPNAVVAEAKRKSSPLHELFEWDLRKAAAAHWIDRARELIVTIKVTITTEHKQVITIPAYVRDPRQPSNEQGYVFVPDVRDDTEIAREIVMAEVGRVMSALRRAKDFADALEASELVEDLIVHTMRVKADIEKRFPL